IFAQIQKVFDVKMPVFQVGTDSTLAFATLIDGYSGIVGNFEEGNNSLTPAVGAADMRPQRAYIAPIVAQSSGPFGEHGVILHALENVVQVIGNGGQIAR